MSARPARSRTLAGSGRQIRTCPARGPLAPQPSLDPPGPLSRVHDGPGAVRCLTDSGLGRGPLHVPSSSGCRTASAVRRALHRGCVVLTGVQPWGEYDAFAAWSRTSSPRARCGSRAAPSRLRPRLSARRQGPPDGGRRSEHDIDWRSSASLLTLAVDASRNSNGERQQLLFAGGADHPDVRGQRHLRQAIRNRAYPRHLPRRARDLFAGRAGWRAPPGWPSRSGRRPTRRAGSLPTSRWGGRVLAGFG